MGTTQFTISSTRNGVDKTAQGLFGRVNRPGDSAGNLLSDLREPAAGDRIIRFACLLLHIVGRLGSGVNRLLDIQSVLHQTADPKTGRNYQANGKPKEDQLGGKAPQPSGGTPQRERKNTQAAGIRMVNAA